MRRWAAFLVLLALGGGPAWASCSNEEARAKMLAVAETLKAKTATKPDEAADLLGEMGDAVSEGVSEALCRKLDALLVRARRL